ncbi:MAG TPA: hypothetical protein VGV92_02965 [Gammaproteobacteria bacterium]|nr:hypothetical protein [Gammaproteobacteria bacterium]
MNDSAEARKSRLKRLEQDLWDQTEGMHDYKDLLERLGAYKPEEIQAVLESKNDGVKSLREVLPVTVLKSIDAKLAQHKLEMIAEEGAVSRPLRYINATSASSPKSSSAVAIGKARGVSPRSRSSTTDKAVESTGSDTDDMMVKEVGEVMFGRTFKMGNRSTNE